MGTEEESLTKVWIDLPHHWATGGESMWALPLGGDLYEIRNTPFYAYGINWGDIVRADSNDPKLKPEVREVVAPSANKTLRVFLNKELSQTDQDAILSSLQYLDISQACNLKQPPASRECSTAESFFKGWHTIGTQNKKGRRKRTP